MVDAEKTEKISRIRARLTSLDAERAELAVALAELEHQQSTSAPGDHHFEPTTSTPSVTTTSSKAVKVDLFRRLFVGRPDVFSIRWENRKAGRAGYAPACGNEWAKGVCGKPQIKCGACPNQAFIPVSDEVIDRHLRGGGQKVSDADFVAGVYPLLPDETCWFLAVDFDKENWAADASAFIETCHAKGIPGALERSRSGNGGHVWIFFSEPIAAHTARQLGAAILTETMERRPEIGFGSYDRFFPSQDTMPAGGFGNLVALPLQRRAREAGNSVFIDKELRPYEDQWAFLSSLPRLSADAAKKMVAEAEARGRVLGVQMPVEDEEADEPWRMSPSRRREPAPIDGSLPKKINIVLADQIYVDRTALPSAMTARLIRLAAFQNPEFYRAQSMRLSTFDKPRIISCAEFHGRHVGLPRGCLDETVELIRALGSEVEIEDQRSEGVALPDGVRFAGALHAPQIEAFDKLVRHDYGVLAATTAFGKTVVAAAIIAKRARNTLILVHRRQLLAQWTERLKAFLSVEAKDIGAIGGGRQNPSGVVDVALIQSLVRRGEVSDLVAEYGHIVVDECHHLSAASFELVVSRAKAKYVLGLSATVARKDGHQPIIFMQCGPVRHRVSARAQAAERGVIHRASIKPTKFQLPPPLARLERPPMPAIYAALAQDQARNDLIFDDVLQALEAKRSPIVLTERLDHLDYLQQRFSRFVRNVVILRGAMSAAERTASEAVLRVSDDQERLILATGRYIGEGFDDCRLDTLFLTMPISWKGTLAQYVGRLHRQRDGKAEVLVVDYADEMVPMLAHMMARRRAGYRALGYTIEQPSA
jgi:superfamily II DNA or RNA helicase